MIVTNLGTGSSDCATSLVSVRAIKRKEGRKRLYVGILPVYVILIPNKTLNERSNERDASSVLVNPRFSENISLGIDFVFESLTSGRITSCLP